MPYSDAKGTPRTRGEFTIEEMHAASVRRDAELAAEAAELGDDIDSDTDNVPLVITHSISGNGVNSRKARDLKAVGVRGVQVTKSMGTFKSAGNLGAKI